MSQETSAPPPPRRPLGTKKTRTPAWRRSLPLLGGVLLVGLIAVGLWPKAVPVEVGKVTRGNLVVTVDEEGMTRVKNRYLVSAPVAGQLRRIEWKAGAVVETGKTVLAVMEASGADFLDVRSQAQAEARVRGAEAAREAAVAQRERARASAKMFNDDLTRLKQLFEQKVLSAQEFDTAQMRATTATQDERAAEFGLQVAEFELQQARAVLVRGTAGNSASAEPMVITSPVSGRVLKVYQESARVVTGGLPLLEIGDPTDLEVRIEVLSRDGVAVRPGARVLLEQWGGPEPLTARVRLVEPSAFTKISALGVEEQRVYVIADFTDPLERRATLGDSFRVEARIVTWEGEGVVHAPAGALFQRGSAWRAFVLENGRAQLRDVKVGRTNGLETEVLDGLRENDRVVVYPGDKVTTGTRIQPIIVGTR
jgi:HlyD family secretion protein